jgi:hypothetical protein
MSIVAVDDINNDNHLDIVVACNGGGVIIFLGDSNGSFSIAATYSYSDYLFSIALADFNRDNHLDFVVAIIKSPAMYVFFLDMEMERLNHKHLIQRVLPLNHTMLSLLISITTIYLTLLSPIMAAIK